MDCNGDGNGDREVLWRIVALLFSLAGLAELARGLRGARRRGEVLGILTCGEAVAWDFIIGLVTSGLAAAGMATGGLALGAPVAVYEPLPSDDAPEPVVDAVEPVLDALQLAARFRLLALVLCVLLARLPALGRAIPRVARRRSAEPFGLRRRRALPAPDTSPDTS